MTGTAHPSSAGRWEVREWSGAAQELHELPLPDPVRPAAWLLHPDRPALVLGSTQHEEVLGSPPGGYDVVRRRSGGSLVVLVPGSVVWVDLVVPRGDERWDDDIGRAADWVGELWQATLGGLGIASTVHRGGLEVTDFSSAVCFAGVGPGEVLVGGRKAVGVSQRRTRHGARFQCAALIEWDPTPYLDAVIAPEDRAAAAEALDAAAAGIGVPAEVVEAALVAELAAC